MNTRRPPLAIESDAWLTSILGFKASKVHLQSIEYYIRHVKESKEKEPFFTTIKVNSPIEIHNNFGIEGLNFVLNMQNYSWNNRLPIDVDGNILIRDFQSEDKSSIFEITQKAFSLSRFHSDPRFPLDLAERLKMSWVLNNLTARPNIHNLVAIIDHELVGYCSLLISSASISIDLIATKVTHRGRGVGSALIRESQLYAWRNKRMLLVGTQESNPANSLYRRCGFMKLGSQAVWHHTNVDKLS